MSEELRRCENRRGRWKDKRWPNMSCGEVRRVEKSWEELWNFEESWDKLRGDEKRWEKLRWHEKRREQLWSAEKSLEMSWDEMGWRRLRWQWDAMNNFQEKLRCDKIRWNEKRLNIQKTWHQIDKSRACCCEAQEAYLSPIGTAFAPLYRL